MNRILLVAAALLIQWQAAFAQVIDVPPLTPLGQPIIAKVDLPEGGKVAWKADAGASIINAGKDRAYLWATPGGHTVQAVVSPGGDADLVWIESTYAVGDAPPVPPPVVVTLAELAGKDVATFSEIVGDARTSLDQFQTVAQVNKYFTVAYDMAKIAQDHPAAIEIKKRVDAAASGSLADAKVRQSLAAALAKIASDLGTPPPGPTPPPVPPVVEGKRLIVIIHEVDDATKEFADLRVMTANNSAAAKYFREKGHIVQFLEEEQKGSDGQPYPLVEKLKAAGLGVPAIFVLDPSTKAVLYQQKLEPGVTTDNLVEYAKRGGG